MLVASDRACLVSCYHTYLNFGVERKFTMFSVALDDSPVVPVGVIQRRLDTRRANIDSMRHLGHQYSCRAMQDVEWVTLRRVRH